MTEDQAARERYELDSMFSYQICVLNAHQVAIRRVLNQLAEIDPQVAKAVAKYEEFYQEEINQSMLDIENKFGPAFAAYYDRYRKIYEMPPRSE